jgi:TP901 family phage tail tape measure protein
MIGALGGGLKAGITLYAIDRMSATVNSATTKAEASMKQMQMRNEAMNKSMLQTSQYLSMMKVGLAGMAVSGVAIGASVKQFADFQKSIAYISTLIDDVKFDYKSMSNDILKIAGETGKDIEDVARGVHQAISTSIEPEKATQFIEVVSKAAVAGGANIETSANAILTVLKSYGMETEKAMEVSDKLFQTVKLGRVEFLQLSDAVAGFAQTGALAGVSIDELLGAFAALTMVGVPVDEASTSLNRFLLSVVDSNKEAQDFAKSLGLEFNVSHLKKVGILAFLDEINSKIGTDVEKIQKLFPEMRAFRAVAPLMNTARESFKKFSGEIETSSGTTEKAMEKMENTISHRVDTIKQKMKGIGIKVGETFALSLEGPITKIDDFLGKTLESEKSINRMQTGLKVILGAGGALAGLGTIGWLTKTIGGIGAGFKAGLTGQALAGGGAIATGAGTLGKAAAGVKGLIATPAAGVAAAVVGAEEVANRLPAVILERYKKGGEEIEAEIQKTQELMAKARTKEQQRELSDYLAFLLKKRTANKEYIDMEIKRAREAEESWKGMRNWINGLQQGNKVSKIFGNTLDWLSNFIWRNNIETVKWADSIYGLTEAQQKELAIQKSFAKGYEDILEEFKRRDEALREQERLGGLTPSQLGYRKEFNLNLTLEIPEGIASREGLPSKINFDQITTSEETVKNMRLKAKGVPYLEYE